MTKATAVKAHGTAGLVFNDPADNSSVYVNKVVTKEADGKPSLKMRGQNPASQDKLNKLAERFKK